VTRGGPPLRVLVVGAGIAGLATARALARAGLAPEVVEREPASREAGAGIYLPGNAARALRALGLDAAVAERAIEIPRQRFLDHRGRLLAEIDVGGLWAGVGPCRALHRAALHAVLRDGAGDIPIRAGVTPDRLAQHDGRVEVHLSDGTRGEYDLVVGADGVHSAVRSLAFGVAPARPLGQVAWRLVAPCPEEVTTWSVMLGRRGAFLTVPIGRGLAYCYCDADGDLAAHRSPERLRELLVEFAGPARAMLDAAGEAHVAAVEEVAPASWREGHVVLVGDAAHATSPNMAEGAALALEDALVLAECLAAIAPVPRALSAFEARRRPRTDWVRAQTHRRDRTRRLPAAVRSAVLRTAGPRIFRANYAPLRAAP
jgi:2-polyprenyl-6-methoxyphenol hydroxylase-like FAD-dependent oxidoreductase